MNGPGELVQVVEANTCVPKLVLETCAVRLNSKGEIPARCVVVRFSPKVEAQRGEIGSEWAVQTS